MSASPMARQATTHHAIPTRRVVIQHEADMPLDYGTTPGGTIFGTTPGGKMRQKMLTFFARGTITVRLSCFTGLDSTALLMLN